jgi:DNA-directed RNA polymerase specialized sigma24 family protein
MTEQETANALDMSLRSVQRLWSDARQRLADLLDAR